MPPSPSRGSYTPSFSLLAMQCSLSELNYRDCPSLNSRRWDSEGSCATSQNEIHMQSPPTSPLMSSSSSSSVTIGKIRFKDGRVFHGEHIRGHLVSGSMTYADGSVYEGGWVKGKRHGRGRCTFQDGSVYEGEFSSGNFHGFGQMVWGDGGFYQGDWNQGEIDGMGMEVRPDGTLRHNGVWRKGLPVRSPTTASLRKNLSTDSPELAVKT